MVARLFHYDQHFTDTAVHTGEHPLDAVRYIDVLGLYHTVFTDPANSDFPRPELMGWSTAYEFLDGLATTTDSLYNLLVTSDEERYLAWVLACIVPFSRTPTTNPNVNPRKVPATATVVAREGIKAPNKVSDVVKGAVKNREQIVELKDVVLGGTERKNERDLFGMAIRRWDSSGSHWRLQVLFAVLDDVMTRAQAAGGKISASALKEVTDNWQAFVDHLQQLELMDVPQLKPLVDGRILMQSFGIKAGKWMAPAMEICMAWQLRNPQAADPAGALDEVRKRKEELGIAQLLK